MLRIAICMTAFVFCEPAHLLAQSKSARKTQSAMSISQETTRITAPLDADGFVDYVQAFDRMSSEGVSSQDNFEVVVRAVFGPDEISEEIRSKYYEKLGVEFGEGPYFVDLYSSLRGRAESPELRATIDETYDAVIARPWTADEYPEVAAWLEQQSDNLNRLVEGSKRKHYYTPYLATEFSIEVDDNQTIPGPPLIGILLPSVQSQREIARSLRIRANLAIGQGAYDKAWDDLFAIHRMSRLVSGGFTLIETLVGVALDRMAFDGTQLLITNRQVSNELIERIHQDYGQLKPLAPMWRKIDVGERFMALDAVQWMARNESATGQPAGIFRFIRMMKLIESLSFDETTGSRVMPVSFVQESAPETATISVNWDITARRMNEWYDRLSAAMRESDYAKRKQLFAEIERSLEHAREKAKSTRALMGTIFKNGTRDALGEFFADILVALLVPALQHSSVAEHTALARAQLLEVAIATERFRRAKGKYPDGLQALTPQYLKSIPVDSLSGQVLGFKRDQNRIVIYSAGRNGIDEGGVADEKGRREQPDDIAIEFRSK